MNKVCAQPYFIYLITVYLLEHLLHICDLWNPLPWGLVRCSHDGWSLVRCAVMTAHLA